ncbi:MAG TPA: efflux RND transporter periplasmic adaptor subunit [Steroidobacteraceae bacterium]|nr:efflux RND transporter periplasmic adaptor subunit [Steroidobacteraceae bacterium]
MNRARSFAWRPAAILRALSLRALPLVALPLLALSLRALSVLALPLLALPPLARGAAPAEEQPSVLVQTAAVKQGALPQVIVAYGTAKTAPGAQQSVVAQVAAVVTAVHVRVGEPVRAGTPLLDLVPTPSTGAAYAAAMSAQHAAADALSRMRRLVKDSLATEQQLTEAEKADTDARAALRALQAQGAAGPSTLRAAFEAVVISVSAAPNAIVAEGVALVELARPGGLILLAGVVPAQAPSIKAGDAVRVEAVGGAQAVDGRVALRGALVEAGSGLVPVEISVPEHALLPGEMARASITIGEVRGYLVPHPAILVNEQGETYVVQTRGGVAKIVPVQILATAGDQDAVSGQIDAAAPVIVAGNHQLQDGMKVRYRNEATGPGR